MGAPKPNAGGVSSASSQPPAEPGPDKPKPSAAAKRRQKRKAAAKAAKAAAPPPPSSSSSNREEEEQRRKEKEAEDAVVVEYVQQDVNELVEGSGLHDAAASEFREILERFSKAGQREEEEEEEGLPTGEHPVQQSDKAGQEEVDGPKKLSRKQRKVKARLTVAELKQLVTRPDVVEAHDVTGADPKLLVHMKAYRNTVPVPRHWCHKRKYLQGKRGIEKKPFELPDFIAMTGISKLRDNTAEDGADGAKRAKARMRERVQPKMGKIDIDYQVLHDAFFKFQNRPKLTHFGELYYEGKEFEVDMKEKKPGHLSAEIREALGMPDGAPPPWLINMQRYGPPPAYPNLRIPGLNAPIPKGTSYGYHPGGWGKPPVDENGNPLYGNVFGEDTDEGFREEDIDRTRWGELGEESEEESEEEEEEEQEAEEDEGGGLEGTQTPMDGAESTMSGLETPDAMLDLRKRGQESVPPPPRELYTVIGEQKASVGGALFGADKKYVLGKPPPPPAVEMSINPDELDDRLEDSDAIREQYEATVQGRQPEREDVSDIMEEENRKRKRKLEKKRDKAADKSFKF